MANVFYLQSGSAGTSSSLTTPLLIMAASDHCASLTPATSSTTTNFNGNNIQITNTRGGTVLTWISPPIGSAFTYSGSVTCSIWGNESATGVNIGPAFRIWHKSGSASFNGSGAETAMMTVISSSATEFGTTPSSLVIRSLVTPNRAFQKEDRILLRLYLNTGSFGSMTSGTGSIYYGGPTDGVNGDSFLQFSQDIPLKQKVVVHDM